jgi:hypothetical protein
MPDTLLSVLLFLALVAVVGVVGIRAGIIVGRRVDARMERAEEDDESGD